MARSNPSTRRHGSSFCTRFSLAIDHINLRQVWTLPKLTLAFSTTLLPTLQNVITDSHDPPALSPPQDPPRKPQELDIEQILVAPLGESSPQPHLFVRLCNISYHRNIITPIIRFSCVQDSSQSTKHFRLQFLQTLHPLAGPLALALNLSK